MLCKAGASAVAESHHVWPMFLGGRRNPGVSNMEDLPKNFHKQFHHLLHYMLRFNGFAGGFGKGSSRSSYEALFKSEPKKRAQAHAILIKAAEIFDKACKKNGKFYTPLAPRIRKQINQGKWDF